MMWGLAMITTSVGLQDALAAGHWVLVVWCQNLGYQGVDIASSDPYTWDAGHS